MLLEWAPVWGPLLAVVVLMVGWWVVHGLNLERDVEAKQRDIQVQYLIEAYRRLQESANRGPAFETDREYVQQVQGLECAIGDIQLFGSPDEVKLARQFAEQLAGPDKKANLDELLMLLRSHLRQQLRLDALEEKPPVQLRISRDSPREAALPPAQEP